MFLCFGFTIFKCFYLLNLYFKKCLNLQRITFLFQFTALCGSVYDKGRKPRYSARLCTMKTSKILLWKQTASISDYAVRFIRLRVIAGTIKASQIDQSTEINRGEGKGKCSFLEMNCGKPRKKNGHKKCFTFFFCWVIFLQQLH